MLNAQCGEQSGGEGGGRLSGSGKQTMNLGSMRSRGHVVAFCVLELRNPRWAAGEGPAVHRHKLEGECFKCGKCVGRSKRRNIGFPSYKTK